MYIVPTKIAGLPQDRCSQCGQVFQDLALAKGVELWKYLESVTRDEDELLWCKKCWRNKDEPA